MRLTNKLCAQHLGWMFKKHWQIQGKRVARDTGATAELAKLGFQVKDVKEVVSPRVQFEKVEIPGILPPPILENETHPNWHNEPCHIFGDKNVPLEGTPQAQVLTKAISINGLPKNLEEAASKIQITSAVDRNVQHSILASHVFDAEQKVLPRVKLPERPAYVLPRSYGITEQRKNSLLISKLIFECEKLAGHSVNSKRKIFNDANFVVSLIKDGEKLQFNLSAESFMTSVKPIEAVKGKYEGEIPDLYPVKSTITIPKRNIYENKDFYPLKKSLVCSNPHTIFAHFSPQLVKNMHETPVTESQFQSRTLLKAFTVAAARARTLYGENVSDLPKPIVVQSIQTDGKIWSFGVFQLNTLDLDGQEGAKNYWFNLPNLDLYTECSYKVGRPVLEGYNKDVFRYISAFYSNC